MRFGAVIDQRSGILRTPVSEKTRACAGLRFDELALVGHSSTFCCAPAHRPMPQHETQTGLPHQVIVPRWFSIRLLIVLPTAELIHGTQHRSRRCCFPADRLQGRKVPAPRSRCRFSVSIRCSDAVSSECSGPCKDTIGGHPDSVTQELAEDRFFPGQFGLSLMLGHRTVSRGTAENFSNVCRSIQLLSLGSCRVASHSEHVASSPFELSHATGKKSFFLLSGLRTEIRLVGVKTECLSLSPQPMQRSLP